MGFEVAWRTQAGKRTADNRDCAGVGIRGDAALCIVLDGSSRGPDSGALARDIANGLIDWFVDLDTPVTGEAIEGRLRQLHRTLSARWRRASASYGLIHLDQTGAGVKTLRKKRVIVESAYRVDAISPAGAGGLTQLMPGTAVDLGVRDRFDIEQNLSGGADYLARQMLRFGDVRLALAAYNSGPGRVARLGRIPEIAETRAYVVSVVECYLALSAGRGARNSRECRPPEGGL